MPSISALMIDSREPDNIKSLKFGGLPVMVTMLDAGDIQAVTDDGCTLIIERKTPQDFLGTLKDGRLFPQMARMLEVSRWAYIVIEEPFTADRDGKVITPRGVTGWSWAALQGTLLSIQELGVMVVYANGAADYESCILRIGARSRNPEMRIAPAKTPNVIGPKETFLAGLPGIGFERVQELLDWSGNNVAHALIGLTDMDITSPIGLGLRRKIRELMGLEENINIELVLRGEPQEPVEANLVGLLQGEKVNV